MASSKKSQKITLEIEVSDFMSSWKEIFSKRDFTDCRVLCSTADGKEAPKEILAHKSILSLHCGFFREAFEKNPDLDVIELPSLPQLSFDNVSALIKMMYVGEIDVPNSDISRYADFIIVSSFFKANWIVKKLTKIVFSSDERVIATFGRLASSELCQQTTAILDTFIEFFESCPKNARLLVENQKFVSKVDFEILLRVLKSRNLAICEFDVFRVAFDWSKEQATKTGLSLPQLFSPFKQCIQFDKIGANQIRDFLHPSGVFSPEELIGLYVKAPPGCVLTLRATGKEPPKLVLLHKDLEMEKASSGNSFWLKDSVRGGLGSFSGVCIREDPITVPGDVAEWEVSPQHTRDHTSGDDFSIGLLSQNSRDSGKNVLCPRNGREFAFGLDGKTATPGCGAIALGNLVSSPPPAIRFSVSRTGEVTVYKNGASMGTHKLAPGKYYPAASVTYPHVRVTFTF